MKQDKRSALITGSGRNIGRAIALELAGQGFNVAINGSSNEKACQSVAEEIQSAGGNALVVMGDIGNRDHVQSIAQTTLDAFGTVDVWLTMPRFVPALISLKTVKKTGKES